MKMLHYILLLSLLLLATSCGGSMGGDVIASNTQFTVTGDSVVQGQYVAYAPSRTQIVTNYVDTLSSTPSAPVALRLAFNMRDNEMASDDYHYIDPNQDTVLITACRPDSLPALKRHTISPDTHCTIRVDMREVFDAFNKQGVFVTATGDSIYSDEFTGVWVLGNVAPLSWEQSPLSSSNRMKLRPSGDEGFYELDITFAPSEYLRRTQFFGWKGEKPHPEFPEIMSDDLLVDALYNMAISTISESDFSELSVSQASLATVLMLADVKPEICQRILRSKVHDYVIEQDHVGRFTFPVVNDRLIWAAAAWQVYCTTGDTAWLRYIQKVITHTLDVVNPIIFCDQLYMVHGCDSYSSPEAQYPQWMQPKDYFESIKLSNNVTYAYCYYVLSLIDDELEIDDSEHYYVYQRVKDSINQMMWNEHLGRYCSFLMHEAFPMQSGTTCNIAQAAAVLLGIADDDRAATLLARTPFYTTGIPTVYPSNAAAPDGGQRPFVQGMWNLAAAITGNHNMLHNGLAAIYRSVAFNGFGNGSTGERILNACATAAMTIKITAGITISPEGVEFNPVVPDCFPSDKIIKNFRYRDATFDITIHGTGSWIEKFAIDGEECNTNFIPADEKGHHNINITLSKAKNLPTQQINISTPTLRPATPMVQWNGDSAVIVNHNPKYNYSVTINNRTFSGVHRVFALPQTDDPINVVYVTTRNGLAMSHASQPHIITTRPSLSEYPLHRFAKAGTTLFSGKSARQVVQFDAMHNITITIDAFAPEAGNYYIDLLYSNGSSTVSVTPISKVWVNTHEQDVLVLPQQGYKQWRTFSYSNMIEVPLLRGHNTIRLQYALAGNNYLKSSMATQPTVLLRTLRLIKK